MKKKLIALILLGILAFSSISSADRTDIPPLCGPNSVINPPVQFLVE